MTLALTPNVKRICMQLATARKIQGQSQAVVASSAMLSIKGLNSLYAGRGSPSIATLDALAHIHGLGPITTIASPHRMDDKMKYGPNVMHLIQQLNAEQALRGQLRQRTVRAESRFVFARLGLGHRILSDRDVYDAANNANASAVAMDVKAIVLGQGGLRLRNPILKYDGGTMDLDAVHALPVMVAPSGVGERVFQGREREVTGQTNDTASDVPSDDDDQQEIDPELDALLFGSPKKD